MKNFLIVMLTLILTSSVAISLTTQVTNYQTSNTKTLKTESNKNQINTFEQIIRHKSLLEQKELQTNLSSAIVIKDNKVSINVNKLDKKLWDTNLYNWIISSGYLSSLAQLFKLKLISFNQVGTINFAPSDNQLMMLSESRKGVWTEAYWYWFGYWKLHLGHDVCEKLTGTDFSVAGFLYSLASAGLTLELGAIVAPFLLANWLVLKLVDKGNGVWIGIMNNS